MGSITFKKLPTIELLIFSSIGPFISMVAIILLEWLEFAVRWVHVITAIAWIGSSFYFIALDLGLKKNSSLPYGVTGEEWQVHGGGFYNIQKFSIAPSNLPKDFGTS